MYNDKGLHGNVFVHGVYAEVNIYETFLNTKFSAELVPSNIRFTIFLFDKIPVQEIFMVYVTAIYCFRIRKPNVCGNQI